MIPVVTRAEMRAFDQHAIAACRVPSIVLMENAGRGAADVIERDVLQARASERTVVVVCGTGNNGGDGFVVARRLLAKGADVHAWLVGDPTKLTTDCAVNMDAFGGVGGRITPLALGDPLEGFRHALAAADVVVDGLLGTGLDREVTGALADVLAAMNEAPGCRVALDTPSGMHADTGLELGVAFRAELTVTFGHPKQGLVTPHGARVSGHVHVVDIGVPASLLGGHTAHLLEAKDVAGLLAPRPVDTHKYRAGHVAIFAGSPGKIGAALLSATSALRGGAGAATIVTWSDAAEALQARVLEVMVAPIDEGSSLTDRIDAALANKRAVVLGPGFGTGEAARAAVDHVLTTYAGPMVFDADALSMHAKAIEEFQAAGGRAVLTPHSGELGRLLDRTSEAIEADRFQAVREAAERANAVVVLKGPHSLVASPDGRLAVNTTGGPNLSTAGAGDVLSGLTGAFLCALPPFEAACAAVYLHGASGDAWKDAHADRGMLAGDIAEGLPAALAALIAKRR